jgi:hypothetical protein
MAAPTARQTFRETVAAVAEKARARLPQAVNGRIESAAKLVLLEDVTPQEDGSILVGSSTDPLKAYRLIGTTCECQDFTRGQAPDGWCQHRIAAGIAKRVQELLPQAPAPEGISKAETLPLPEAPASVNVHIAISGRDCQLTLRDSDEDRLLQRLAVVLQQYPVPCDSKAPTQRPGEEGWCGTHQVAMRWNEGKHGQKGWYSHKSPEGQWCKGRKGAR